MNTIDDTKKIILKVKKFLDQTAWGEEYASRLQNMVDRVEMPCELAIAGMVKAGKSSFSMRSLAMTMQWWEKQK